MTRTALRFPAEIALNKAQTDEKFADCLDCNIGRLVKGENMMVN